MGTLVQCRLQFFITVDGKLLVYPTEHCLDELAMAFDAAGLPMGIGVGRDGPYGKSLGKLGKQMAIQLSG